MHSPDLLGTGTATPKPRRFYTPSVWAEQLDAYARYCTDGGCVRDCQAKMLLGHECYARVRLDHAALPRGPCKHVTCHVAHANFHVPGRSR